MAITTQMRTDVANLYVSLFGRAPERDGLGYWVNQLDAGKTVAQVADMMYATEPARATYPTFLTNAEIVHKFYVNVLGRADAEGEAFWTNKLNSGTSKGALIQEMISAVQSYAGTDTAALASKALLANKVTVGLYYAVDLGGNDVAAASAILANVTSAASSVDAAKSNGATSAGSTVTLTKIVQALSGTAGNDTFIAGDEGGSATLNAGDTITGGSGTDTLKLFNAAGALNAANFANAVISGVEAVEATLSATTQTLDVSGNADVVNVGLKGGTDGVVTLGLTQQAALTGTITTAAAATFAYKNVAGAADTATLNLSSANTAGNTTATNGVGVLLAGVETLNVAATGTNVLGTLAVDATKLVVTGSGSVSATLKASAAAASVTKTIDASAATGAISIDNKSAAAQDEVVTTGSGNDVYTTTYANLNKDDKINLGSGTDSLRFSGAATFNDSTTQALLTNVTGVEQLGVVGVGALTVDGDNVTQTSFLAAGTGHVVLSDIANNSSVTFGGGAAATASTVAMKLGANTLNVNLAGSATAAADVTTGLTVTGSATLNVSSTGTAGVANNVLALTAADNQSVVVTGSQNLTLTAVNAPSTTGFSVDASAFTGKLSVTGTNDMDIIKGGSGDDTIQGAVAGTANQADTLTGGAGVDKFVFTAATGATFFATSAGTTAVASITDFVAGTDKFSFVTTGTAFTGVTLASAQTVATAADLTAVYAGITAIAASTATNASAAVITVTAGAAAGTYLYVNDAAAATVSNANDMLIKITGVTGTISAADFVFA